MLAFAVSRLVFYLFQWRDLHLLSASDIAGSFLHGAHMDASFAGYIALAMAVIILLTACFSAKGTRVIAGGLTGILLLVQALLTVADAELFKAWGFRLDATPLMYMKNPSGALASTPIGHTILLIGLGVILFIGFAWIFYRWVYGLLPKEGRAVWWNAPVFLLLGGCCILPMRGGLDTSPMNQGTVFFSSKPLANQAALNMLWNVMFSVIAQSELKTYTFMPDEDAKHLAGGLLVETETSTVQVLNTPRPNVIVIIMESFSSPLIERLGGEKGVTPRFNAMIDDGLLFSHIYADGHRTERGLVAVLSGYPSQSNAMPVIQNNSKLAKIPMLSNDFRQQGYTTAFYYGGDISFVNTRSYVLTGFQRYTDKSNYPNAPGFSWGAHDEAIFEKILNDLDTVQTPFFYSVMTLSNHQPHTIPIPPVFEDSGPYAGFKNSAYYADKCMGDFVDAARTKSWWDNTLLIFVADHGIRFVSSLPHYDEHNYRIPMLWLGGALNAHGMTVDKLGSQRDIANTLLTQLGMPATAYKFSKNLLNKEAPNFAFYTYNDGFGFVKDSSVVVYDNAAQCVVMEQNADSTALKQGQALLQILNNDFLGL
ncbi:MAG: LTA synthase family protein [Bacteroidales bacterium]|nr:LTA synthase family protein [Bacteroidales bacterium]